MHFSALRIVFIVNDYNDEMRVKCELLTQKLSLAR